MKLSKIEIRNFRSIRHLCLEPKQLTTLIGKNSCGKSNILRSLQFFFTAGAKSADQEDFCKYADENGTWVECTFSDLTAEEKDEVAKYLSSSGAVRIRRILLRDGDRCVAKLQGYIESPSEPWLQEGYEGYADLNKWKELGIDISNYAALGKSGKPTKDTFKEFRQNYVKKHAAELNFNVSLSETEFKGRQSTAISVLPHFIFVPAVGDIASVICGKQSSLLNEIVTAVIEIGKSHPDYLAAQASLVSAQEFVNPSGKRLKTLEKIELDLAERLRSWPGTKVTIRTQIEDLAKILVNGLVLTVDDGHDTNLSEKGDGIQRQILFRVFQLYADFRARRGIFQVDEGLAAAVRSPSIIAFEEPELFLHPQAQEQFFDDLLVVSESDQILLATHSSFLIRLEHAHGLHIVHRSAQGAPTEARTAQENWLHVDEKQRLREITMCSADVSKIFFADRVVVTEGQEDIIYLKGTAWDHAKCFDRSVTLVEAGGKESIPALQAVLNAFQIPYVVVCDLDPGNDNSAKTSERIKKLVDVANEKQPGLAQLEHFDPDIPACCRGDKPPVGDKPYHAVMFMRNNRPKDEFIGEVRKLFTL